MIRADSFKQNEDANEKEDRGRDYWKMESKKYKNKKLTYNEKKERIRNKIEVIKSNER